MHENPRESEAQILTVTVGRVLQKATPHSYRGAWPSVGFIWMFLSTDWQLSWLPVQIWSFSDKMFKV